jgi:hypothetical protein
MSTTDFSEISARYDQDSLIQKSAPEEVMTIFESGAAAGYLNQEYYATSIDDAYAKAFREIARKSFRQQANKDGKVEMVFNRIYLLAVK